MTKMEFAPGWKLLVLQPWAWRYNQMDQQGKPTEESRSQLEFYFEKLQWAHPHAWMKVAGLYAQGAAWPSLNALTLALRSINGRYVPQLTDARSTRYAPMPEDVRTMIMKGGSRKDRL